MPASIRRPRRTIPCSSTLFSCSRPSPRLPPPVPSLNRKLFNISPSAFLNATGTPTLRSQAHTRVLPYSHQSVFKAVSSIDTYSKFLPFTLSSRVLQSDANGFPSRAILKVGYDKFGLEEDWESLVSCDPAVGTIEARSVESASTESIFETLKTRWQISPVEQEHRVGHPGAKNQTEVRLDLEFKIRSAMYDQMFAQLEGKVASALVGAFEKRAKEIEQANRQAKVKFL